MPIASTQQFIEIAGIQEGIILLKNGGYRLIMSASAINFSLKSEEEQNSLIFQYQGFLNSLHFPIQIVMRSKKLDLNPYLRKVNDIKEKQTNELLKYQTEDYVDFINQLINMANIMKKSFYVIVPYDPVNVGSGTIIDKLFKHNSNENIRVSDQEFKRYKEELFQRANTVASGLGGLGIHCVQLNTEEIIELFYKIYNPEIAEKERFGDVKNITSSFIANTSEKAENIQQKKEDEVAKAEKETVIDNSAVVEDQKEQEVKLKEQVALKDGEKQIATTPLAPVAQPNANTNNAAKAISGQLPPAAQPQIIKTPVANQANILNNVPNNTNNPTNTPPNQQIKV